MKLSNKAIAGAIAFLGVLVLALTFTMYYSPKQDETAALETENTNLSSRITQLETYAANADKYQEDTVIMIQDINKVIDRFPANSLKEDAILYALELESRNEQTIISSVAMPNAELIYEIPTSSVPLNAKEEEEGASHNFKLYRQQISVSNQFTYNGMKQFVTDIVNDVDTRNIENMSLAYDANTGILVGNTTINIYTLSGTDEIYKSEEITSVPLGTSNVFGTIEVPAFSTESQED